MNSAKESNTEATPTNEPTVVGSRPHTHMHQMVHPIWRWYQNIAFKSVKLASDLCGIYVLIVTFTYTGALGVFGGARDPITGFIIDPNSAENTANGIIEFNRLGHTYTRAVVSETNFQMFLTAVARFTAFFMYPSIVLIFWTKFRALQAMLERTPLSTLTISDTHRLHEYCGWVIVYSSVIHTIAHLVRWGVQGNMYLLFHNRSGLTGFVVFVATAIIVIPMTCLKQRIRFEIRKYAHYFFWLFCAAMTFHAPIWALPNAGFCGFIFPALMIVYFLDASYVKLFMTERVDTVKYECTKSGVQLTMPVSAQFQKRLNSGGYGYIMFDWIDKHQWHAYSIYEDANEKESRRVFIAKAGDWTDKVHRKIDRNTVRPVWICGPFPSPYSNAINFDNMILVASGIGITPALSAIEGYRDSRRINLIWAVRDASMLVFFLKNAKLDHKGFNLIFYTGQDPLPATIENFNSNAIIKIVPGRPNLSNLIPNIIQYIHKHGQSEHEKALIDKKLLALALIKEHSVEILQQDDGVSSPKEHVAKLVEYATELGYSLMELLGPRNSQDKRFDESKFGDSMTTTTTTAMIGLPDGPSDSLSKTELIAAQSKSDIDLEWADFPDNAFMTSEEASNAKMILAKVHGIEKQSSQIIRDFDAKCNCPADHIAYPHHTHSIWKTSQISNGEGNKKKKGKKKKVMIWEADPEARPYVKGIAEDDIETYGLLYCGGRNKLLEALVQESNDLKIPLHTEAFDW